MPDNIVKPVSFGIFASLVLLGIYFGTITLISGWSFAKDQFSDFWYFVVSLAVGFGIQIGLYMYLRDLIKGRQGGGKVLGVTGATSTMSMVSCCAHYLANLLPVLAISGMVTLATQYQIQLFWAGLIFNFGGIAYMINKVIKIKKLL